MTVEQSGPTQLDDTPLTDRKFAAGQLRQQLAGAFHNIWSIGFDWKRNCPDVGYPDLSKTL